MLSSRWRAVLWASAAVRAWACLLFLTATASKVHAQCATASAGHYESYSGGSISGVVLDPDGRYPVAGARVYAFYDGPQAGLLSETHTDGQGRFLLTQVALGPHWVVAEKEEDGYPGPLNALYDYEWWTLPKVNVEFRKIVSDVTVRLFSKAGKLIIRVFDAATELPIESINWEVSREDDTQLPRPLMSRSSRSPEGVVAILLPPRPCTVRLSATGYDPWYYGKDGSREAASGLVIPAGETREVMVFLHRNYTNGQGQLTTDHGQLTTDN